MKNVIIAVAVLGLAAAPALADVSREDIKKLAAAGVSDDVIIAFIKANGPAPKLSADDIVDLKKGGVSDKVVEAFLGAQGTSPRVLDSGPAAGGGGGSYNGPAIEPQGTRVYYVERPVYTYVPSTSYYYSGPSIGVIWCSSHRCYDRCSYAGYYAPTYSYTYSYPRYSYSYGHSHYPSWGFSYYSGRSCGRRSGWGVSVRW